MIEKLKKLKDDLWKGEKPSSMESEVEENFKKLSEMAAGMDPTDPNYELVLDRMDRYVGMKKDLSEVEEEPEKGFKAIAKKVFDAVTDPKVIATGIASAVYVWWGQTCMKYDADGQIPPNRMLGNGPKPPKVG